jgi:transposase
MARTKTHPIVLTPEERGVLERLMRSRTVAYRTARRARLVLLSADGATDQEVARQVGIGVATAQRWRSRFVAERLAGLEERPRRGRPPRYAEADRARVISTVCTQAPPDGATHWTVRSLAQATGVGRDAVHRILQEERLQPHRVRSWLTSTDPEFESKAVEILGLYLNPPENALVLSVDEKTNIQALDRTQPTLPLRPGQAERRSFEYKRNGTTSLYAALAVHSGEVVGQCTVKHRHQEFLDFIRLLVRTYPDRDLHLIVDNFSAHKHASVGRWLERHHNVHLHFTPTYASWLNQVELWFSILSRKVIRRGVFPSVKALVQAIMAFIDRHSREGKAFKWTMTSAQLKPIIINRTEH